MGNEIQRFLAQLPTRTQLLVLLAPLVLGVLFASLYVIKPALHEFKLLEGNGQAEIDAVRTRTSDFEAEGVRIGAELTALRDSVYGGSATRPIKQLESYVIHRLDGLAGGHDVNLLSVTPDGVTRVERFDEIAYEVDATGDYLALYGWLRDVEQHLRPMALKQFEIRRDAASKQIRMHLRLVSYRPGSSS